MTGELPRRADDVVQITGTRAEYVAIQGVQIGEHQLSVPGRHEADALTDCCPRLECFHPTRPAAVLDEVMRGRCAGRYGIYRCPACGFAWLCRWSAPTGRPR